MFLICTLLLCLVRPEAGIYTLARLAQQGFFMSKETSRTYGLVSQSFHWLSALAVFGLFMLGVWMVDLTYYSDWYKTAPHVHKSVGVILLGATVLRLFWRLGTPKATADLGHKPWEVMVAKAVHGFLYLLLMVIMIAGVLISTADGRGIWVFNWFELPGFEPFITNQADIAGSVHEYLAYTLIGLVLLHAAGALKHHFIDKDKTLLNMLPTK